jgi:transposase
MVYQQTRRWLAAGCFEAIVHDLRAVLRFADGRAPEPTAVVFDSRTMQSTPESGGRAGYDGYKRRKGSKVHMAVDTLGHLLALRVTPADVPDRDRVAAPAEAVQEATGDSVELASVDQGYTGADAEIAAADEGIDLEVVKLDDAKRGFVLLPRRWVVERSYGWAARFRRLARDYERLSETLEGMHYVAFSRVRPLIHVKIGTTVTPPPGTRSGQSEPRTGSNAPACRSGNGRSTPRPPRAPSSASLTRTGAA